MMRDESLLEIYGYWVSYSSKWAHAYPTSYRCLYLSMLNYTRNREIRGQSRMVVRMWWGCQMWYIFGYEWCLTNEQWNVWVTWLRISWKLTSKLLRVWIMKWRSNAHIFTHLITTCMTSYRTVQMKLFPAYERTMRSEINCTTLPHHTEFINRFA